MTKRAILYARVSGDDRGNDGRNLSGQLDMCREYAQRQGWQVVAELAEDERGVSGARMDAPQLNRALDMAAAGQYDVLVVREIDRLARDVGKQYIVEGELKRSNVKISYVLGEYPDTPEGALNKNIKAVIAEYERTKISERLVRGRRREAKRGSVLVNGRVPYGYDLIHDGDKYQLAVNDKQAEVVRLMFAWYTGNDRVPLRTICDRLNEAGITAPRGGQWQSGSVRRMLTSETYVGRWYYGKFNKSTTNDPATWIAVNVPMIVDSEIWQRAQERRQSNLDLAARNTKREYLLRGRAKCGACGWNMRLAVSERGRYYRCARQWEKDVPAPCDHRTHYRQDIVDALAWQWVEQLLLNPEALESGWLQYQTAMDEETAPIRSKLAIVDDGIAKHKAQLSKVLDLYLSDAIDKGMLFERQQRLETMLSSLGAQHDELNSRLTGREITKDEFTIMQSFVSQIAARLGAVNWEGDIERMQQVLDILDVKATLGLEEGEKVLYLSGRLGSASYFVQPIIFTSTPAMAA